MRGHAPPTSEAPLNAAAGQLVVSLGRHSIVNRVDKKKRADLAAVSVEAAESMTESGAQSGSAPEDLVGRVLESANIIEVTHLRLRRNLALEIEHRIHDHLSASGLTWSGGDYPLDEYLSWMAVIETDEAASLLRLARRWREWTPTRPPQGERRLP